jgi:hypothetical protein
MYPTDGTVCRVALTVTTTRKVDDQVVVQHVARRQADRVADRRHSRDQHAGLDRDLGAGHLTHQLRELLNVHDPGYTQRPRTHRRR